MSRLTDFVRSHFIALDLRGKITVALLSGVFGLGAVVMLLTYVTQYRNIVSHTQSLLEAHARLESREIELQLGGMIDLAESIAGNTVTANALADSRGRETYLEPLLSNQKLAIAGAELHVTDYQGRHVAASTVAPRDFDQLPLFVRMMQTAKPVVAAQEGRLVVVMPVIYRLSGSIEGSVILDVPLAALLNDSPANSSRRLEDDEARVLAGRHPTVGSFELATALHLPAPLEALSIRLVLTEDKASALRELNLLLAVLAGLGLVVILGMIAFARVGARFITASLGEIAVAAETIAASGRPVARLPVRRDDEFGRLSAAFNTMVDRLAESYGELEQRVIERTREYEESQQEANKASSLLREAVSSIAQGFTIYDENDRLVICNDAYKQFYEDSRDLIEPGNTFEEIVRRGAERGQYRVAEGCVDAWVRERVRQHQSACGQVLEQQLGDGRWLLIVEHRTPSGYTVGNRIDITELKRTAEALRQRELYLRATLDNLPFFFWLKDAESRFLAVNKVFADACGRGSPEAVVGLTDFDVWPRELAERYASDDAEVIASKQEKAVEEPVAGGSQAGWIETYKKPVIAADGSVLGTVGFARDISDRREAETRLRDRTEQLNAIFDLSPDGFVSFDAGRRVKYASPAFFRMTGLTQADIVGLDEGAFAERVRRECLPGSPFPGFAALRASRKAGIAPGTDPGAAEEGSSSRYLIELGGVGKRVLEVGIRLSQAETVSQILYFRDVTHETEVDRLKSEFLSTAAHELRTPMASIYGFTELLLNQNFEPEEQRDFLETIFKQSELMVSIVNELLDLARIEARRGKDFVIEHLPVRDVLREVVAGFKPPAGRDVPLMQHCDAPALIRADRKKLMQAISNVLSNAYKYSPGGGPVGVELLDPERSGGSPDAEALSLFGIRITDVGIGMTREQLARVCERFYRADTSGKIPGTGLGMSIVKEIIDLLEGRIDIASQPDQGTQVTLWLPLGVACQEPAGRLT